MILYALESIAPKKKGTSMPERLRFILALGVLRSRPSPCYRLDYSFYYYLYSCQWLRTELDYDHCCVPKAFTLYTTEPEVPNPHLHTEVPRANCFISVLHRTTAASLRSENLFTKKGYGSRKLHQRFLPSSSIIFSQ